MVEGGWWNPMIFILPLSIWQDMWFKCRWESSFPYIFSQKSCRKNPMFLRFVSEKLIFANFHVYIFNASKFLRARWLNDVTVTSYEVQWYSFWYQWIKEVHTYTLVVNILYQAFCIENPGRGLQQPSFRGHVTKNTSGGRGLKSLSDSFGTSCTKRAWRA